MWGKVFFTMFMVGMAAGVWVLAFTNTDHPSRRSIAAIRVCGALITVGILGSGVYSVWRF